MTSFPPTELLLAVELPALVAPPHAAARRVAVPASRVTSLRWLRGRAAARWVGARPQVGFLISVRLPWCLIFPGGTPRCTGAPSNGRRRWTARTARGWRGRAKGHGLSWLRLGAGLGWHLDGVPIWLLTPRGQHRPEHDVREQGLVRVEALAHREVVGEQVHGRQEEEGSNQGMRRLGHPDHRLGAVGHVKVGLGDAETVGPELVYEHEHRAAHGLVRCGHQVDEQPARLEDAHGAVEGAAGLVPFGHDASGLLDLESRFLRHPLVAGGAGDQRRGVLHQPACQRLEIALRAGAPRSEEYT